MHLSLGPLLGLEGNYNYSICFLSPIFYHKEDLNLVLNSVTPNNAAEIDFSKSVKFEYSKKLNTNYFYRFSFEVPANEQSYIVNYTIQFKRQLLKSPSPSSIAIWNFHVPGNADIPTIAFMSCNGTSNKKVEPDEADRYNMWSNFFGTHTDSNSMFNALIMGGDQIYADTLWSEVSYFKEHNLHKGRDSRFLKHHMEADQEDILTSQLESYYETLYINSWSSNIDMANALASIPSIMMWDDHDIFDGYGSHKPELQGTKLFKIIFKVAKKYFELLQLRGAPSNINLGLKNNLSYGFSFRNYEIVVLDNRSNRTRNNIMLPQHYSELSTSLNQKGLPINNNKLDENKTLCFVIPVPVAHLNYSLRAQRWMRRYARNRFRSSFNDDGIDHWDHDKHTKEHKQLLDTIIDIGMATSPKYVLIVSGDVHSAGASNVTKQVLSEIFTINQYISSAIVHKPVSKLKQYILDKFSSNESKVSDYNIKLKHYGPTKRKTFYSRNFAYFNRTNGTLMTEDLIDNKRTHYKNWASFKKRVDTPESNPNVA